MSFLNVLTSSASFATNNNQVDNAAGNSGFFANLINDLGGIIPSIADLFLVIAVIALIVTFGMIAVEGPQKVQQSKGHLIRIMIGAGGIMCAAYFVGFFASLGGKDTGDINSGYQHQSTIMPTVKLALSHVAPTIF